MIQIIKIYKLIIKGYQISKNLLIWIIIPNKIHNKTNNKRLTINNHLLINLFIMNYRTKMIFVINHHRKMIKILYICLVIQDKNI